MYRGDMYYADLSPVVGCEQGGVRPVLIDRNLTLLPYATKNLLQAFDGIYIPQAVIALPSCRFRFSRPDSQRNWLAGYEIFNVHWLDTIR